MSGRHVKYLIIGGGVAGSAAVEAIRRHDPVGSILFVGQESSRPYLRPALSKEYLRREIGRTAVSALPTAWYAERNVELKTGQRVSRLDTARLAAALASGEEISFDSALIATGAVPTALKIAGSELPGLHYLRTLEDADRLLHALDMIRAQRQPRVAVIGAGLIGTEVAASLAQTNVAVTLLDSLEGPWRRIAGPATAEFLTTMLTDHGVTVRAHSPVVRLEGDGRVQRIVLGNGATIPCDVAVAAVGTTIGRDLLRGTPIAAETAILIDGRCQTNVPSIFAAGDCSAILDPLFGKHRIVDHLDHARLTGNIAGSNMAGGNERYTQLSYFWSEVFHQRIDVWGESKLVYRHVTRGDMHGGSFAEFGIAEDDRVAQVVAVGRTGEHAAMKYCVEKRLNVSQWESVLVDPNRDLRDVM